MFPYPMRATHRYQDLVSVKETPLGSIIVVPLIYHHERVARLLRTRSLPPTYILKQSDSNHFRMFPERCTQGILCLSLGFFTSHKRIHHRGRHVPIFVLVDRGQTRSPLTSTTFSVYLLNPLYLRSSSMCLLYQIWYVCTPTRKCLICKAKTRILGPGSVLNNVECYLIQN